MPSNLYFWRDSKGIEVDILIENVSKLLAIEVKSGQTVAGDFFDGLKKFSTIAGKDLDGSALIYAGKQSQNRKKNESHCMAGYS